MADNIVEPLPHGYQLGDYLIDCKIGGGGFSLVYLAYEASGEPVAIKEYLPDGVVKRVAGATVQPINEDKTRTFLYGMKFFFEEGRALATIQHPNVVRVTNFFRANETVYMVMKYERGKTLQQHIRDLDGELIRESFLRGVFIQLLNGLRDVHTHKLLHLDIKPANIYIREDATPVLLDFGAARQSLLHDVNRHAPMYTPGFAAPEQYSQTDRLGPWTDIYAIGASLYNSLGRVPPPAADIRQKKDTHAVASKTFAGQFSPQLLELIDSMLQLNYMERPQSVFAVQKRLIEIQSMPKPKPTLFNRFMDTLNKPL